MVTDQDLVYLAGNSVYHSSDDESKTSYIVNGKEYTLIETKQNENPQYAVYQNFETGEYVLALNGTNFAETEDVATDVQLAGEGVPPLHNKALNLYNELNAKYGISAVCGNSLGGSLANYISVNTGVRSVTINPAVLPNDPETLAKDDSNITNYVAEGDPLDKAQEGTGIKKKQMPGKCIEVSFGIMTPVGLLPSHVGYAEVDENGVSRIVVGEGKEDIIVDVSQNIVTNPFTNKPVGETESSYEIEINSDTMGTMKKEITEVKDECLQSKKYVDQVQKIAQNYVEIESFDVRQNKVYEWIDNLLQTEIGSKTLEEISSSPLASVALDVFSGVESLNNLSNFLCSVITSFIPVVNKFDIFELKNQVESILLSIPRLADDLIDYAKEFRDELFKDVDSDKYDQFVVKLKTATTTINRNSQVLNNKLQNLENQVGIVHDKWLEIDEQFAQGILTTKNITPIIIFDNEPTNTEVFEDLDKDTLDVINNYDKLINKNFKRVTKTKQLKELKKSASKITKNIKKITEEVGSLLDAIVSAMEDPEYVVDKSVNIEEVYEQVLTLADAINYIDDAISTPLTKISKLDDIIKEYEAYIKSLIFTDTSYSEVIMYYDAARFSFYSNQQMLSELIICIDENKNETIRTIKDNMEGIKTFLLSLCEQIDVTVVHN